MKTFADKLKSIRKDNGWTLEEMSEKLGTSKQVLSRYERGERIPKISTAKDFAEKLNIPLRFFIDDNVQELDDLIFDFVIKDEPATTNDDGLSRIERTILAGYHNAPENIQRAVETLLGVSEEGE